MRNWTGHWNCLSSAGAFWNGESRLGTEPLGECLAIFNRRLELTTSTAEHYKVSLVQYVIAYAMYLSFKMPRWHLTKAKFIFVEDTAKALFSGFHVHDIAPHYKEKPLS